MNDAVRLNTSEFINEIMCEAEATGVTSRGYLTDFDKLVLGIWGYRIQEIKDGFGEVAGYRILAGRCK